MKKWNSLIVACCLSAAFASMAPTASAAGGATCGTATELSGQMRGGNISPTNEWEWWTKWIPANKYLSVWVNPGYQNTLNLQVTILDACGGNVVAGPKQIPTCNDCMLVLNVNPTAGAFYKIAVHQMAGAGTYDIIAYVSDVPPVSCTIKGFDSKLQAVAGGVGSSTCNLTSPSCIYPCTAQITLEVHGLGNAEVTFAGASCSLQGWTTKTCQYTRLIYSPLTGTCEATDTAIAVLYSAKCTLGVK